MSKICVNPSTWVGWGAGYLKRGASSWALERRPRWPQIDSDNPSEAEISKRHLPGLELSMLMDCIDVLVLLDKRLKRHQLILVAGLMEKYGPLWLMSPSLFPQSTLTFRRAAGPGQGRSQASRLCSSSLLLASAMSLREGPDTPFIRPVAASSPPPCKLHKSTHTHACTSWRPGDT